MASIALLIASIALRPPAACDGVTYADDIGALWVPTSEIETSFKIPRDPKSFALILPGPKARTRELVGTGDAVVRVDDLRSAGVTATWDNVKKEAVLTYEDLTLVVGVMPKHVTIGLAGQELRAFQGCTIVMKTEVSTGRNNSTPAGHYVAGGKSRMHYSHLFNNVPMPYCVSVSGNIFLHGYTDVPTYPASHGCIRMKISAAKALYEWIEVGTPITIE